MRTFFIPHLLPYLCQQKERKKNKISFQTHTLQTAPRGASSALAAIGLCLYLSLFLFLVLFLFLAYFSLPLAYFFAIHPKDSDSAMLFGRLLPKCVFLFLQKLPKRSAYITLRCGKNTLAERKDAFFGKCFAFPKKVKRRESL